MDEETTIWIKKEGTDVTETDSMVVYSTRDESDSTRLIQNSGESCDISYEETVSQEVVHNEQETGAEELTRFTMLGTHTQRLVEGEEEDSRVKYLRENVFHGFSCSFCLQSFPSKYGLIMHVFIHIDGVEPPEYVCKSCGEVFPRIVRLNRHMKMCERYQDLSPGNNERLDCSDDHKNVFLENYLEVCLMEQIEEQSSPKETTKISNKSRSDNYNEHNIRHSGEKRDRRNFKTSSTTCNVIRNDVPLNAKRALKCDDCENSFTCLSNLKRHALIHSGIKPHQCAVCGKSFSTSSSLKNHGLIHAGIRPHKCGTCGKSFTQLGNLKSHALRHAGIRPHTCNICGKSFTESGSLQRHSLIHTGIRPHKCDTCGKSFSEAGSLKRHTLIHTGIKPHRCEVCGKSFSTSSYLKNHGLIHAGIRPHKCDTCGKSFTLPGDLKKHALLHTGMKPYECNVCGKCFARSSHLKSHSFTHIGKENVIHTGMKPYQCEVCGKSFATSSYLKIHRLIHAGIRPYNCDTCGKSFTQLGALKRHSLLHTGMKLYECNVCGKCFARSSHLKSHSFTHIGKIQHN